MGFSELGVKKDINKRIFQMWSWKDRERRNEESGWEGRQKKVKL
jgi:hypothetical protein